MNFDVCAKCELRSYALQIVPDINHNKTHLLGTKGCIFTINKNLDNTDKQFILFTQSLIYFDISQANKDYCPYYIEHELFDYNKENDYSIIN